MKFPSKEWEQRSLKEANINEDIIKDLFNCINKKNMDLHALKIIKDGYLIIDVYKQPFDSKAIRDIYSAAKSYLSVAIGIAIDQGLINLNDAIISFFPEIVMKAEGVSRLTIKHLLTMSTGHKEDDYMKIWKKDDWIKAYFEVPISYNPGTKHIYNNFNSFVLSAIIKKVTGMRLLEFLEVNLLKKIGIKKTCWAQHKNEVDFGASGYYADTDNMSRFGHLLLNHGNWKGEQIVSENYLFEATKKQIDSKQHDRNTSWSSLNHGYGYHFWKNEFGSFSARGMLGQDIIIIEKYNMVISLQGDWFSSEYELFDLISDYIIPACEKGYTNKNNELMGLIKKTMSCDEKSNYIPKNFIGNNKLYQLEKPIKYGNVFTFLKTNLTAIGFKLIDNKLVIDYHNNNKIFKFNCGLNNIFIENELMYEIGNEKIDLRYALRGSFNDNGMLNIEIQPLSHAMRMIHEIEFVSQEMIKVKTYLYNKEKSPVINTKGNCVIRKER